jgi:hypothetical protein
VGEDKLLSGQASMLSDRHIGASPCSLLGARSRTLPDAAHRSGCGHRLFPPVVLCGRLDHDSDPEPSDWSGQELESTNGHGRSDVNHPGILGGERPVQRRRFVPLIPLEYWLPSGWLL